VPSAEPNDLVWIGAARRLPQDLQRRRIDDRERVVALVQCKQQF
jgi:hypothetical protein